MAEFQKSRNARLAAIGAETAAYTRGAHDVRLLATLDGQWLSPIEGECATNPVAFSIVCAVEIDGYWAGCASSSYGADARAARALEALCAAAAAGRSGRIVAEAGLSLLEESQQRDAIAYGLGGGIGRNLLMSPAIALDSDEKIRRGDVLWLRTMCIEADVFRCASAMVLIDASGRAVRL